MERRTKSEGNVIAGTHIGGQRAAKTNKLRHGGDFYRIIGKAGGKNGHTGGFYDNKELASWAGRIGGKKSKRPKRKEQ